MAETGFIESKGDYRGLIVYKKAVCIYDISYYFAHQYLAKGDRTIDQMVQAARSGKQNNNPEFYSAIIRQRDDETIANLCITMIRQELYLLVRLIERAKDDFLKNGGIREEMTRARLKYRNGNNGRFGNYANFGSSGSNANYANFPNSPNDPNNPINKK